MGGLTREGNPAMGHGLPIDVVRTQPGDHRDEDLEADRRPAGSGPIAGLAAQSHLGSSATFRRR